MNDWLGIRLMSLRVVTWLLKDCHGNEIEVTDMNDWLGIRLMYLRVVTWLLKDCHGNIPSQSFMSVTSI
jgi:hypothetical protein